MIAKPSPNMAAGTQEKHAEIQQKTDVAVGDSAAYASEEASDMMKLNAKGVDEAGAFADAHGIVVDPETNKRILRKIDFRLMPIMCGLYLLQYLDKVTLSYAAVMGIRTDTGS